LIFESRIKSTQTAHKNNMKKLVMSISLLAGASVAYSQGTINWTDYIGPAGASPGFSITIWGTGTETPGTGQAPNNTSVDLPTGNATYTGTPLGAGFEVGLYVDTSALAVASDVATGSPLATSPFSGGPGFWSGAASLQATDAGIAPGTSVFTELAAWSTADGATSYAMAVSQGVAAGVSGASTGTSVLGGGTPPATAGTLLGSGLQDFALTTTTVPEPSTIALGVIGASTFLMRLRRKQ
jgi:hypothetical protein